MMGKIHFNNINLENKAYDPQVAYNQSKLANVLFCRELTKRLGPQSTIDSYCLHPGIIKTELFRHANIPFRERVENWIFIDPELGAQTTLYCALEPTLENESGFYYE